MTNEERDELLARLEEACRRDKALQSDVAASGMCPTGASEPRSPDETRNRLEREIAKLERVVASA